MFLNSTTTVIGKRDYQKWAYKPTICLALHFELDIQNLASTGNLTTMIPMKIVWLKTAGKNYLVVSNAIQRWKVAIRQFRCSKGGP